MNRHKKRAAASYDIPLSDSKLFVLYACQSENGHIRMRQPFSYLSLRTLPRQSSNHLRSHLCEHTGSGLLRAFGKLKTAGVKTCSKHFRNLLIL